MTYRPSLEPLEPRIVLATFVWDGSASSDWFNPANWTPDGVPGGSDTAVLNIGSTIVLGTATSVGAFTLSAGTLTGAGALNVIGDLTWTGGSMTGTGVTNVAGTGSTISGAAQKNLGRVLNNTGTMTYSEQGGGAFAFGPVSMVAGILNNSGTFNMTGGGDILRINTNAPHAINNTGSWNVTGPGTSVISDAIAFNNSGTVSVQSGTFALSGGGVSIGSFTVSAGATLNVSGNVYNLNEGSILGTGITLITSGTVIVNATSYDVESTLALSGGLLTGAGALNLIGDLTWTGGSMTGTGVTNVAGTGSTISGAAQKNLGRVLNNTGTMTYLEQGGGAIAFGPVSTVAAILNNSGTFNMTGGGDILRINTNAPHAINNTGSWNVAGPGTSVISDAIAFNNSGTVSVQSGTLALAGGGTSIGTFAAASGATLRFDGGTHNLNSGSVSADGTVEIAGGTWNLNGGSYAIAGRTTVSGGAANFNIAASTVLLAVSGGTLGGSGTFEVTGDLTWTGGSMTGTGVTNVAGTGSTISGAAQKNLGRVLNNTGTMTYLEQGGGAIAFGPVSMVAGVLNNSGTFNITGGGDILRINATAPHAINNTGSWNVAGPGTSVISDAIAFNNSGTVNVQSGTLALGGGGTSIGSFAAASGATLRFDGGTHNLNGGGISGGGTTDVSGGTVNVNATSFQIAGPVTLSGGTFGGGGDTVLVGAMTWSGGAITGSGVVLTDGGLLLNGAGVTLSGRTLQIPPGQTATMTGTSSINFSNGAILNSFGTFLARGDSGVDFGNGGGAPSLFMNAGTFTRDTSPGDFSIAVGFVNSASVTSTTSSLIFSGGLSQLESGTITGGLISFTGGSVSAAGLITGSVSNAGAIFSPGSNEIGQLTINGSYTQNSGGTLRVDLGGTVGGQFDRLIVNGTAILAGTLNVALVNGFAAALNQQFPVLAYQANTGTFTTEAGAFGFTRTYQATGMVLTRVQINYSWDSGGGADTDWFTPANWSPDGVPTIADAAALNSAATISLAGMATVASFSQSAGILTGAGTLTAKTFTWTGGTQAGTGSTNVTNDGLFSLGGPALKILTQRTLNQGGAGVWSGSGSLQLGNGAVFSNSGSFDIQNAAAIELAVGGGEPLLNNSGTLAKTAAGVTTFSGLRIENSGAVRIDRGTLGLGGAGASFTQVGGSTTLSGGKLMSLSTLTFAGGELAGSGMISANVTNTGATIRPGGTDNVATLQIDGNYTQAAGATIAVRLGGKAAGTEHDQLRVNGTATIEGAVLVSLINSFSPKAGTTFNILVADSLQGTYSSVDGDAAFSTSSTGTRAQLVTLDAPLGPSLSINDASLVEGNSGSVIATFTITLSETVGELVTVTASTQNGTAESGSDFLGLNQSLQFAPGETSKTIDVTVFGGILVEADETFRVVLTAPTNAAIARGEGTGTILNDDEDFRITSGGGVVSFTDVDGDRITVKTSRGTFTEEIFSFGTDGRVVAVNLAASPNTDFTGTKLTFVAQAAGGGDGLVDIDFFDAQDVDLKKLAISGNLGRIVVGDGTAKKPALKSLSIGSLGTEELVTEPLLSEFRGSLGKLSVAGDVRGAAVDVQGVLGKATIGGDWRGDKQSGAALLASLHEGRDPFSRGSGGIPVGAGNAQRIGTFSVKGFMSGGSLTSESDIGTVSVGQDMEGAAIAAAGRIKVVKVFRDVSSDDPDAPALIAALARVGSTKAAGAVAIDNVRVGGNVENAQILLGYKKETPDDAPVRYVARNPDASAGKVVVNGNWVAASLVAGVFDETGDGFGQNDQPIDGDTTSKIISRIASIVIKGAVTGTTAEGDHYGFTAQQIGKLSIAGEKIALLKSAKDNLLLDETNGDFRLVEV
jgi:fibronectin-binding autotransporter adhesin